MMIARARTGRALFIDMVRELGAAHNLCSYHVRRMMDVGLISMKRNFNGNVPETWLSLTPLGWRVLAGLKAELDAALASTEERAA